MSGIETYRGTVYRWEVDNVDHFTVAYYFARFEDATLTLLEALGLGREALAPVRRVCAVVDCRVRFLKELRVGDILHIRSGVIAADETSFELAHEVYNSGDGGLSTTLEQRAVLMDAASRAPLPLEGAQRRAADALRIPWDGGGPGAPDGPQLSGEAGLLDAARDTVKAWEVDTLGQAAPPAYIHRFSAANAHLLAGFGMTPAYMRDQQRGFSTFEFRLRFPGALRAGDLVRVRSGLLHVGNSSIRIMHRMANARTGEVVATLEQSGVHLDLGTRRAAPLPEDLRMRAKAMLVAGSSGGAARTA